MSKKQQEVTIWRECMKEIVDNGGAVFSNKALRKYFREHCSKNAIDKSCNELADVYGQLVSQGVYFEKLGQIERNGFIWSTLDFIADEVNISVRRVSKLLEILVKEGLIEKKKKLGSPNKYRIVPGKLTEMVTDITFKHRRMTNKDSFHYHMRYGDLKDIEVENEV